MLVYIVHLQHMRTPARKCGVSGGMSSLPTELLSQVLKHLDLSTKLQAHTVCRRWNRVLSEPCCADLWTSVPEEKISAETLKDPRKKDLEQYVNWLADRAAGIPYIRISTDQWTPSGQSTSKITEARFFYRKSAALFPGLLAPSKQANQHILIYR